jgi:hypothetical protein
VVRWAGRQRLAWATVAGEARGTAGAARPEPVVSLGLGQGEGDATAEAVAEVLEDR